MLQHGRPTMRGGLALCVALPKARTAEAGGALQAAQVAHGYEAVAAHRVGSVHGS